MADRGSIPIPTGGSGHTGISWLLALCILLAVPAVPATEQHPLAPVDTSSPRATLLGFLDEVDTVWEIYRDQYWHSPSKELNQEISLIKARALRALDLSEIPPSARTEGGYDGGRRSEDFYWQGCTGCAVVNFVYVRV